MTWPLFYNKNKQTKWKIPLFPMILWRLWIIVGKLSRILEILLPWLRAPSCWGFLSIFFPSLWYLKYLFLIKKGELLDFTLVKTQFSNQNVPKILVCKTAKFVKKISWSPLCFWNKETKNRFYIPSGKNCTCWIWLSHLWWVYYA